MAEENKTTTPSEESTNQTTQTTGFTTSIATAYSKATAAYDHVMAPIREINEYVDEKNQLDHQKESGELSEEMYNQNVEALQKETFGEDLKNLSIANKFEAVADWKEAHGIDQIENSIHDMTASIKDAFSKTALGQKFEEIKQLAAEMGGVHEETQTAEGPEGEEKYGGLTEEAWVSGADLPENTPDSVREQVQNGRQSAIDSELTAQRAAEAEALVPDAGGEISAEVSIEAGN